MSKRASVEVSYEVLVTDKDGKVISREARICRSLLKNFAYWLYLPFSVAYAGYPSLSLTDTLSQARTVGSKGAGACSLGHFGALQAAAATHLYGIVIGTTAVAPLPTDVALGAQIQTGVGAGQLVHNAQSIEVVATVGSVSSFRMTRTFTNNHANPTTVNEIGLYISMTDTGDVQRYFAICKDLLAASQTVNNGQTLTVRYTVSVTT